MIDQQILLQRFFGVLIFIAILVVVASMPIFREGPDDYPLPNLIEAKNYVDVVPADIRIPLTPDNQPVSKSVVTDAFGAQVIDGLRLKRRVQYRPAWVFAEVEIVVIPNFLRMSIQNREQMLADKGLRRQTMFDLVRQEPSTDGCVAHRYQEVGWSAGGFVLVDPAVRSMKIEEAERCAIAGFDYILGVPAIGQSFVFQEFPPPDTSIVVLDYLKQCSYSGESDVTPRSASRSGITNFPSITCIRRRIGDAVQRGRT